MFERPHECLLRQIEGLFAVPRDEESRSEHLGPVCSVEAVKLPCGLTHGGPYRPPTRSTCQTTVWFTGVPADSSWLSGPPGLVSIRTVSRHLGPQNELAWGYATPALCSPRHLGPGLSPPPPSPCTYWLFVDANTGHEIDVQPVASPGWPA